MMRLAWRVVTRTEFLNDTDDKIVNVKLMRQAFIVPGLTSDEPCMSVPVPEDDSMLISAPDGAHWQPGQDGGLELYMTAEDAEGLDIGKVFFTIFTPAPEEIPTSCPE